MGVPDSRSRLCARAGAFAGHGEPGGRYLLVNREPIRLNDFAAMFARLAGRPLRAWRVPRRWHAFSLDRSWLTPFSPTPCSPISGCAEPVSASNTRRSSRDSSRLSKHSMTNEPQKTSSTAAPDSFEAIVLPHLDAAFRLARWLTGNQHDAEDVVQEASVRAIRHFRTFTGGNGRAWS